MTSDHRVPNSSQPLVSVIVPTRNSATTLGACLASIVAQTYPNLELIVVDRDSTDHTKSIARQFTPHVYNHGPERSAQRNLGAAKATGALIAFIDSDMELTPAVIQAAVTALASAPAALTQPPSPVGVIIPEVSFGDGFWAQCKALERSFYAGQDAIEAARLFPTSVFNQLHGYDATLVAGEDWDLSARSATLGLLVRIMPVIRHNEGHIRLAAALRKKYYYARHARQYLAKNPQSKLGSSSGPLARYRLFFSRPGHLFRQPLTGLGMLTLKTAEYAAGALGYYRP
jgi:glycosyltransferase involved in cell wall biosynthesis